MSSSDLPSSDQATESKEISDKEDLDSIDASLDAILSEAKEVALPVLEGSSPAEEADTVIPPPADIQVSLSESATGSDVVPDGDGAETPLPVIVEDEEPSYRAFADMVAPPEEAKIELAPPAEISVAAPSEEAESGEILDADALIDSMTPAPEPAAIEAAEAAAAELARTEESQAFAAPTPPSDEPPTDEEILDHVKLPPGATPMPLVATTASSEVPGSALGDDDQTVISPMPPIPEPAVLPPPPRFGSAWASPAADQTPSILLAQEGLGTKVRRVAVSRVQTSVATMAVVVIGSCALGAAVMRLASPAAPAPAIVAGPAPAKAEPAHAPDIAPLPAVATPAPAEPAKVAAPVVAEKTEKAQKPAPKPAPAKAKPAPQGTHIALAAPAPSKPAPAKAKPAAPAKPKKAAQGGNWVDPFGQ
jgi:hypothetical protein